MNISGPEQTVIRTSPEGGGGANSPLTILSVRLFTILSIASFLWKVCPCLYRDPNANGEIERKLLQMPSFCIVIVKKNMKE